MSNTSGSSNPKSVFDAAKGIVAELEGMLKEDQSLALKFAMETLKLQLPTSQAQVAQHPTHLPQPVAHPAPVAPSHGTDIKSFTAAKAPRSDQQFAAVVAYYYQFEAPADQRKDSIDAATMRDAARLAQRKQVNDWSITLSNAMRSGYLDKGDRNAFKLSAVGENLVAITLPDNAVPRNNVRAKTKPAKQKKSKAKKA